MIPSIFECVEYYRSNGRINSPCAYAALGLPGTEESKRVSSDSNTRYLIDAFALMTQYLPAFMRDFSPDLNFTDTVKSVLIAAEAQAKSMGHTVDHSTEDEYRVRKYAVECALQNLNNPRRKGETWSSRMERLLSHEGVPLREWSDIIDGLPYYHTKEFLAMPHLEDGVLCMCIHSYRYRDSRPVDE